MNCNFKRNDLRSGYVVALSTGGRRLVIRAGNFAKILINPVTGEWNYLNCHWNEDMTYIAGNTFYNGELMLKDQPDIEEVYGLITGTSNYRRALNCDLTDRPLLWQRRRCIEIPAKDLHRVSDYLKYDLGIPFSIR